MPERVGITGVGWVTGLGDDPEIIANALRLARPVAATGAGLTEPAFYDVTLMLKTLLGGRGWRHHRRAALMACLAGRSALRDGGVSSGSDGTQDDLGLVLAYNHDILSKPAFQPLRTKNAAEVLPFYLMNLSINASASLAAIDLKARGFALTLTSGFTAGLEALAAGVEALRDGRAMRVLAGGVEEKTETLVSSVAGQNQATHPRGHVVPGEGCAMLLLEREQDAAGRGQPVKAWVAGFGMGAQRTGDPAGLATERAVRQALHSARLAPAEVDGVYLSANGDPVLDAAEAGGLARVFLAPPPGAAVKQVFGETLHAAGSLNAAAAVLCAERGFFPGHPGAFLSGAGPRRILVLAQDPNRRAAALMLARPE